VARESSFDRLLLRARLARKVLRRKLGMDMSPEDRASLLELIHRLHARAERVILARFDCETYEEWSKELRQLDAHGQRFVNEFFEDFHFVPKQSVDLEIDRNSNYVREKHLGEIPFHNKFTLMKILLLLAETPGKEFSKEALAQEVWGQTYNPLRHDNNIYININRLRKLLEPNPRESRYIMNGSKGYYFNPSMKVNISSRISDVSPRAQGLVQRDL
jgi:DNA-binding response OmpR family regulator